MFDIPLCIHGGKINVARLVTNVGWFLVAPEAICEVRARGSILPTAPEDRSSNELSIPASLSPPIGERDISYFWFRRDPGENCESHGFQSQLSSHHFSRLPWFLLSTDGRLPRFLYRAPRNVIFPGRASRRLPIFAEAIIAHRPSNCPFGLVLFVFLSPRVSSLAARSSSAILSWIPKLEQPIFLAFVPSSSSSSSFSTRSFAFSRLASIFASTKRNRLRTYRRVTRWWFVFEL